MPVVIANTLATLLRRCASLRTPCSEYRGAARFMKLFGDLQTTLLEQARFIRQRLAAPTAIIRRPPSAVVGAPAEQRPYACSQMIAQGSTKRGYASRA